MKQEEMGMLYARECAVQREAFLSTLDELLKRGIKPQALTVAGVSAQGIQYPPPPKKDADGVPLEDDDDLTFASAG